MTSTCPACLKQIEHEEHLFEVHCNCGTRFNPFDTPTNEFAESTAAFKELREFGEGLETPAPTASASAAPTVQTLEPAESRIVQTTHEPLSVFFTSAQMLPGYQLVSFVAPISAWGTLRTDAKNPLHSAFESLAQQAQELGANAVVDLRWNPLPDGSKVIVSGSAIRCSKN